jgi:multidrug resistance efflux pump
MSTTRKGTRTLVIVGCILLAASAGSAVLLINRSVASDPTPPTAPEGPRPVVCFGHVDVESGVTSLYPVQPGRVAAVFVKETEKVSAGKVLLRLDDRAATLRVAEAKAALQAAQAALALAKQLPGQHQFKLSQQKDAIEATEHRLAMAKYVLARKMRLAGINQGNDEEIVAAQEQVKELEVLLRSERGKYDELLRQDPEAEMRRANAEVALAQARVDQALAALDECDLKAPRNGEVLRLLTDVGDVLSATPKQPAVLFCPDAPRLVRAEVDQEFAGQVALGLSAVIEDDTQPGVAWRGRVLRLSDWYTQRRSVLMDPLQFNDVRTIECLVSLEGEPPPRIGQRLRVRIGGP